MKKIAVLRSNPKDATIAKMLNTLSRVYKIECFIWDRQHDFKPIIDNTKISYKRFRVKAGFYNIGTFIKLFLFDIWLFFSLLTTKVDCIQAVDLDTGFVGLCIAKLKRKPFVYFCEDPYYAALPKNWPKFMAKAAKWLENFVITNADIFIITDLLRMPQHEGAKPKKVMEIANVPYMDLSKFKGTEDKGFLTGYIGSLTEGRNLPAIIEAAGDLKDYGIRFVIGGFGPLEASVAECAKKHDNITYVPWVPYEKLLALESDFKVFIHISDAGNETQKWVSPNKLFESMAFGKPIIVGEGTLTAKRVLAIGNGVAVPYNSKEEIKRAIILFKNDPDLAREMGRKGEKEFECNWRSEVMEKRLLDAYASLERG